MEVTHLSLLTEVRGALGLSRQQLATVMGSSLRTVERMYAGRTHPSRSEYGLLIRATYPKDPVLAARIAAWVNGTLEEFGVIVPAPPPKTPPSTPSPNMPPAPAAVSIQAIDSVLCAAGDAADLPLGSVRRILAAAFVRASGQRGSVDSAGDDGGGADRRGRKAG